MTHIHGDISQVLEILKTAYTEEENESQSGWVYHITSNTPPGTSGVNLTSTPSGKTALAKRIQITCQDAGNLMWVQLFKASEPGTLFFGSYFVESHKWDLNDTIIPANDNLDLRWTNNAAGNVYFTIQIFIVDAVGVLT